MKNSLNENYIFWLERYKSVHKDLNSGQLIKQIAAQSDIKNLIKVLTQYLELESVSYSEISLGSKLSSWKIELESIVEDHRISLIQLETIKMNSSNFPLVKFIQDILSEHQLLLHIHMPSLLKTLCNDHLSELISYIIDLPVAPTSSSPPKGSFAAERAQSPEHFACIALLNNLSAVIDEKHPLWNSANRLLQTSLLIYRDLELVTISLEDDEVPVVKEPEKNCILM